MNRLWWEQTDAYWEMPFFSEFGINNPFKPEERDDEMASKEQLYAVRKGWADLKTTQTTEQEEVCPK